MLLVVRSEPIEKGQTHFSRINYVNDMRHVLLFPDGLAAHTHNDILGVDSQ